MTDEAKALVERDSVCAGDKPYTNGIRDLAEMPHVPEQLGNVFRDCAHIIDARNDLIETQAREIKRLRHVGSLLCNFARHDDDCRSYKLMGCNCGYTHAWKKWREALAGDSHDQ